DLATGLMLEVDFRLSDFNVPQTRPTDPTVTMGLLQLGYAVGARSDGLSDAQGTFTLRGLRVVPPNARAGVDLGEFTLGFGVQGFRLQDIVRIRDAFLEPQPTTLQRWQRAMEVAQQVVQGGGVAGSTVELAVANVAYSDGGPAPAGSL